MEGWQGDGRRKVEVEEKEVRKGRERRQMKDGWRKEEERRKKREEGYIEMLK